MAGGVFAAKEDLQDLRSKGIVFSAPLASRCVVLAALVGSAVACWEWVAAAQLPDTVASAIELGRTVGAVAAVMCLATVGATLIVSLSCNGFTLSAGFLALRVRPSRRERLGGSLGVLLLGAIAGGAVAYGFAGELFLLLRPDGSASLGAGVGRLALRLAKMVIVGALGVAVLAAMASRVRFLWQHRPRKGAREQ